MNRPTRSTLAIIFTGLMYIENGVRFFPIRVQGFQPGAPLTNNPLSRVRNHPRSPPFWGLASSTSSADESTAAAAAAEEDEEGGPMGTFTTPPMKVYIEDTDAYGIMYNSNYLRSFDRALHMTTTTDYDAAESQGDSVPTNLRGQHEGWSIVSVGKQRFAASPYLGQDFVIQGRLQKSNATEEVWDMEMTSLDGSTVYNTVKDLTIQVADDENTVDTSTHAPLHSSLMNIPGFDMNVIQPNFLTKGDCFTVYRDEIDAHWQGHLPLRNVLNLMERSRTNALGGPEGLRRLQQDKENGVVVVVTGVSDLTLVEEGVTLVPGRKLVVETAFVVKRRGMILECYQTLRTTSSDARLAQGKVTLMLLDATTRRPTTKLPVWLRELLQIQSK